LSCSFSFCNNLLVPVPATFFAVAVLLVQFLLVPWGESSVSVLAVSSGEGNQLFDQVVRDGKGFRAEGNPVGVSEVIVDKGNPLVDVSEIKKGALVVFDGKWIETNVDNLEFHDFLRDAVSKEIKLVTIGSRTSKFFEALHLAGVNELRRENGIARNPAYWDPPWSGIS